MNSKNAEIQMEHPKKTKVANAVSEMLSDVANAERFAQKHVANLHLSHNVSNGCSLTSMRGNMMNHDSSARKMTEDMLVESSAMLQEKDKTIGEPINKWEAKNTCKPVKQSRNWKQWLHLHLHFPEITVINTIGQQQHVVWCSKRCA